MRRVLVAELIGEQAKTTAPAIAETMREWLDDPSRFRPFVDYFATMLAAGGEGGNRLFDLLLRETGTMRPSHDPEMRAIMVTLNGLAPLLLREQLARILGVPLASSAAVRRMTLPSLELYTHGLYTDTTVLDAARAALEGTIETGESMRSDKGPGNP